jgi:hypothetical protein
MQFLAVVLDQNSFTGTEFFETWTFPTVFLSSRTRVRFQAKSVISVKSTITVNTARQYLSVSVSVQQSLGSEQVDLRGGVYDGLERN